MLEEVGEVPQVVRVKLPGVVAAVGNERGGLHLDLALP